MIPAGNGPAGNGPANGAWPARAPRLIGLLGVACVAAGYVLELVRQRGTCDDGDASPDTIGISVVLILFAGGLLGLAAVIGAAVRLVRHRGERAVTPWILLPGLLSLAGALSIFVFAGGGPSTLFQHCGS